MVRMFNCFVLFIMILMNGVNGEFVMVFGLLFLVRCLVKVYRVVGVFVWLINVVVSIGI